MKQETPTITAGNKKLSRTILNFSMPPGITCGQQCPGCYALKFYRLYKNSCGAAWDKNFRLSRQENFVDLVFDFIAKNQKGRNPAKYFRIHVSGDFYSREYGDKWALIMQRCKDAGFRIRFYAYTKSLQNAPAPDSNFNLLTSYLPDGRLNYGAPGEIDASAREFKAPVCPVTKGKKVLCGEGCKLCITRPLVLFYKH